MTDERAVYELFHETLDSIDITGQFQRLQLELEKPGASRRRGRRIFMTRNRMVLIAAALVLLLVVGVVLTARVTSGLRVGQPVPGGINQGAVAQLLSRPLALPHVNATDQCQDGPYTGPFYGAGPVIGNGDGPNPTAWGSYWDVFFYVPIDQKGPIVARAEDLKTGAPVVFLGQYGVGAPYGSDVYNGKTQVQYTAIAFDTAHPPTRSQLNNPPGAFGKWTAIDGTRHGWTGCFGYQVDGPGFSEQFFITEPADNS